MAPGEESLRHLLRNEEATRDGCGWKHSQRVADSESLHLAQDETARSEHGGGGDHGPLGREMAVVGHVGRGEQAGSRHGEIRQLMGDQRGKRTHSEPANGGQKA